MKEKFIGYYDPTDDEIDNAWENGIFAFDANTLLNLYRYTEETRKDFLEALIFLKDRLFLPYQSAYEYHNNRLDVINNLENAYTKLLSIFRDAYDKQFQQSVNEFKRHPTINIDKVKSLYSDFLKTLEDEMNSQNANHPDFKAKDYVQEKISEIFKNSVGDDFSSEDLSKIYEEGADRYRNEVPPGYKDTSNKSGTRNVYGDFIIWKELLRHIKANKKAIIFVTDDLKEDWWTRRHGKTIRPREELIKEFYDHTGERILIYNADNFLTLIRDRELRLQLKDETIKEIKGIREADEVFSFLSNLKGREDLMNLKKNYDLHSDRFKDSLESLRALEYNNEISGFNYSTVLPISNRVNESLSTLNVIAPIDSLLQEKSDNNKQSVQKKKVEAKKTDNNNNSNEENDI
ncbi:PIN domain-containing protein [Limibacterium fermenti]|uniref:PIN domain-containing protein n=1 Tax=Limibacterium fermenti TaxID=3229863 RepID=UPI000E9C9218|nr:hypothetical protein [Porphyromonadaceae bacterium]